MNSWAIVYEYCEKHPNCRNAGCRKTVVVQTRIQIPEVNLLKSLIPHSEHVPWSARNMKNNSKKKTLSAFCIHTMHTRALKQTTHRIPHPKTLTIRMPIPLSRFLGIALLAIGLGGIIGPLIPELRLEANYVTKQAQSLVASVMASQTPPLPKSAPIVFEPLKAPDGTVVTPVNRDFSIIIPKIGVNAPVIADVDPTKPKEYDAALLNGVAHASTSFFPDQNGTVYIFSHSTNYEWFVKDLNAVFYLVKNLEKGDNVVLIYKGRRYTYKITDKQVVAATNTSYLTPEAGKKSLILETCWPPGSTAKRLLIFADLIQEGDQI